MSGEGGFFAGVVVAALAMPFGVSMLRYDTPNLCTMYVEEVGRSAPAILRGVLIEQNVARGFLELFDMREQVDQAASSLGRIYAEQSLGENRLVTCYTGSYLKILLPKKFDDALEDFVADQIRKER